MSAEPVCAKCRHVARGTGTDMRPPPVARAGMPAPSQLRPSYQGGAFICGRQGLTPSKPDPVSGFVALPSGPDCRDLNPDGECEDYQRGMSIGEWSIVIPVAAVIVAWCLLLVWGG